MKVEDMRTVAELREFAAKANIEIPADKKTFQGILSFLKNPPKAEKSTDPTHEAAEKERADHQAQQEEKTRTDAERVKRAVKEPLNEKEKAYLAELELLARSGHQPDTDQMRDLGILRQRAKITKLSIIEENELAEMEVRRQNPDATPIPSSGVTEDERFEQLEKRRKLNEEEV